MNIKKGDIVGRKSYNKDIFFIIEKIIKINNDKKYAILKGLTIRIEADAPLEDLEIVSVSEIKNDIKAIDMQIEHRKSKCFKNDKYREHVVYKRKLEPRMKQVVRTGKILHLDGDARYSEKSIKYYRELGLNAIVKNIPENKQPLLVRNLLAKYNPDILIITGHDSMLKNGKDYNNVYNYRNSRHLINTVKEARKWANSQDELVIFAGACQSFFEGIMMAGANFASSPERILIDFIDPLIIAEKVATTDKYRYITINEIAKELKEGMRGVGGTRARGKREIVIM